MILTTLLACTAFRQGSPAAPKRPEIGTRAPELNVRTLDGKPVRLAPLLQRGPVVLVVLRGYPGYQCPFCTVQVGDLIGKNVEFARRGATVVLVYPGPAQGLETYAKEFVAKRDLPKNFRFTLDPGYALVNAYGLRWDAPHETAYPSTFVVGRDGRVRYVQISASHGDRAPILDVLAALDALPKRR